MVRSEKCKVRDSSGGNQQVLSASFQVIMMTRGTYESVSAPVNQKEFFTSYILIFLVRAYLGMTSFSRCTVEKRNDALGD